jgi:hypothetical protein
MRAVSTVVIVVAALCAGIAVALSAAQAPDVLPGGPGFLQSRIECSARPITSSGPELARQIRDLENAVKRETDQLRDLGDRFRTSSEELENVGNQVCQQRLDFAQRVATDMFGNVFDTFRASNLMKPLLKVTPQNRNLILNILQNRIATRSPAQQEIARSMIRMINDGAAGVPMADALQMMGTAWSQASAAAPSMFTCGAPDATPQMETNLAVLANSIREITKEAIPWVRFISPLIDQGNWVAWYTLYRSGPRAIKQFGDLTTQQMVEWETTTCTLKRDVETLKNARQMLTTEAEVRRIAEQEQPPQGGGMSAGSIVGISAAAVGAGVGGKMLADYSKKLQCNQYETQMQSDLSKFQTSINNLLSCGQSLSCFNSREPATRTTQSAILATAGEWCSCLGPNATSEISAADRAELRGLLNQLRGLGVSSGTLPSCFS